MLVLFAACCENKCKRKMNLILPIFLLWEILNKTPTRKILLPATKLMVRFLIPDPTEILAAKNFTTWFKSWMDPNLTLPRFLLRMKIPAAKILEIGTAVGFPPRSLLFSVLYVPTSILTSFLDSFIFNFLHAFPWKPKTQFINTYYISTPSIL